MHCSLRFILFLSLVVSLWFIPAHATTPCEKYLIPIAAEQAQTLSVDSIRQLKIMTFNVENLFMHVGHYEVDPTELQKYLRVSDAETKPKRKVRGTARAILDELPHLVVLQEVESLQTLQYYSKEHLENRYHAVLFRGNDSRGIDIGFLVRRDLPFKVEFHGFKNQTWINPKTPVAKPTRLFSRDLPVLLFRLKGTSSERPLFMLMGTHNKSKRSYKNSNGIIVDPESRTTRRAQIERTAAVIEEYQRQYGADIPMIIAGDFNADVNVDPDFTTLLEKAKFKNSLDLVSRGLSEEERTTHAYFPGRGIPPSYSQFDALLLSPSLQGLVLDSKVYRYKKGIAKTLKPLPRRKRQRDRNPSDHWPVTLTLDFQGLLQGWRNGAETFIVPH